MQVYPQASIADDCRFHVSYIKGASRAVAMHVLCFLLMRSPALDRVWKTKMPELFQSMQSISVVCKNVNPDKQEVAFQNAAVSAAGSIRQKHTVITWVMVLNKLSKFGRDPGAVINEWNARATEDGQIKGAKRVGCLAVIRHMPEEALLLLSAHNQAEEIEHMAFADDAFANKKVLPGHVGSCCPVVASACTLLCIGRCLSFVCVRVVAVAAVGVMIRDVVVAVVVKVVDANAIAIGCVLVGVFVVV